MRQYLGGGKFLQFVFREQGNWLVVIFLDVSNLPGNFPDIWPRILPG